jgi:bifunctional non-homologous end joining protein LigD
MKVDMLEEYQHKRDFTRSAEPPPSPEDKGEGPLVFVVHKHAARQLHYDFRLELEGVLKSWAVPRGPSYDPDQKRLAVMVEDHPLDYRFFEGKIPEGEYGAGEVIIWDYGTYSPDENGALFFGDRAGAERIMRDGLDKGKLSIFLRGRKLKGSWALAKMAKREKDWLLIKHRDEFASAEYDVLKEEHSVLSGLPIGALKDGNRLPADALVANPADLPGARRSPFPTTLSPMLATPIAEPFSSADWVFEPKLDGYRVITLIRNGKARLLSRRGLDITSKYALLEPELSRQPVSEAVLDGEIIALDARGRLCFQCLQNYLESLERPETNRAKPSLPIIYYTFDILYLDGYDLLRVPLKNRKDLLGSVLQTSQHIRLVDYFEANGRVVYQAAIRNGLEGIVAKHKESIYEPGRRSRSWLKVKATRTDDFIIGGYTLGSGGREHTFGALLLGYYNDSSLVYAGHVGTGFNEQTLREIRASLDRLTIQNSPFFVMPPVNAPAAWVRPELVAEVKYSKITKDGYLRMPVFLRLRDDKSASEVRKPEVVLFEPEQEPLSDILSAPDEVERLLKQIQHSEPDLTLKVLGESISFNNLDKQLWPATAEHPAISKRDFITYLARISSYLLPYLRDRPLTFSRYPEGIYGEHFFQKHWSNPLPPFVETVNLATESGKSRKQYILCNNLPTLLWLGQIADLEIHAWFSRVKGGSDISDDKGVDYLVRFPDYIIFDIDPFIYSGTEPRGAEPELNQDAFSKVCEVTRWLKATLDQLSLPSYVKTSGATGIHVYVPILRKLDYKAVRSAAKAIARFLYQQHPGEVTLDWAVGQRRGKVFIDYNQNMKGKTLISLYSPRSSPEATVSTPLRWEELNRIYPTDFTIFTIPERLKKTGDIWSDITQAKSDLSEILKHNSITK